MERTKHKKGWSRWKEPSVRKVGADGKNQAKERLEQMKRTKRKKGWSRWKELSIRKVGADGKNQA